MAPELDFLWIYAVGGGRVPDMSRWSESWERHHSMRAHVPWGVLGPLAWGPHHVPVLQRHHPRWALHSGPWELARDNHPGAEGGTQAGTPGLPSVGVGAEPREPSWTRGRWGVQALGGWASRRRRMGGVPCVLLWKACSARVSSPALHVWPWQWWLGLRLLWELVMLHC
jgi:hypothetical protein